MRLQLEEPFVRAKRKKIYYNPKTKDVFMSEESFMADLGSLVSKAKEFIQSDQGKKTISSIQKIAPDILSKLKKKNIGASAIQAISGPTTQDSEIASLKSQLDNLTSQLSQERAKKLYYGAAGIGIGFIASMLLGGRSRTHYHYNR